jgi:tRNA pseudouridine55 synthase
MTTALLHSLNGFVCINKTAGVPSRKASDWILKLTRNKTKVGHLGTLDPNASGLLLLLLGAATKFAKYLPDTKAYTCVAKFGVETESLDFSRPIVSQRSARIDSKLLTSKDFLSQFVGRISQSPPAFSAVSVQGARLYKLARRELPIDIPLRTVEILSLQSTEREHACSLAGCEYPEIAYNVHCRSGTYIRSLVRDIGVQAKTGATLTYLTRTQSNGFDLSPSTPHLQQLTRATLEQTILPLDLPFLDVPALVLLRDPSRSLERSVERLSAKEFKVMEKQLAPITSSRSASSMEIDSDFSLPTASHPWSMDFDEASTHQLLKMWKNDSQTFFNAVVASVGVQSVWERSNLVRVYAVSTRKAVSSILLHAPRTCLKWKSDKDDECLVFLGLGQMPEKIMSTLEVNQIVLTRRVTCSW